MLSEPADALLRRAAAPVLGRIARDGAMAPEPLKPVFAHIGRHLFDPSLRVGHLRGVSGGSYHAILTYFRAAFDRTPRRYVEDRRLEIARRLLTASDLKIWQVAKRAGFSEVMGFIRAFRRWAGVTPSAYRSQTGRRTGGGGAAGSTR